MFQFLKSRYFALLLVLVGGVTVYVSMKHSREDRLLAATAVETEAVIESVHWTEGKRGQRRSGFTGKVVFALANGESVNSEVLLPNALGERLKSASSAEPIRIRYVPSDTRIVRMADEVAPRSDDRLFGLGLIVAGVLLFWRRQRSLADTA